MAQNFSGLRLAQANNIASAADYSCKNRRFVGQRKTGLGSPAVDSEIVGHGVTLHDSLPEIYIFLALAKITGISRVGLGGLPCQERT
jgi:hypothetical protein